MLILQKSSDLTPRCFVLFYKTLTHYRFKNNIQKT